MALTKEDLQAISDLMDSKIESSTREIKQQMAVMESSTNKKLDLLLESIGHVNERYSQLDTVEKTVEDHGTRLFAVEQKVANK